jgi:hypothetical protein
MVCARAPLKLSSHCLSRSRILERYKATKAQHTAAMSQKRKHEEVGELDAANPSTTKKPRSFPHAARTRHKRPNAAKDADSEYGASANALKNRIRDLKRLLAHVDNVPKHKMSASSRIERERELAACEHELEEKTLRARESEHRKKMIGKYHQVRFFGAWCWCDTAVREGN